MYYRIISSSNWKRMNSRKTVVVCDFCTSHLFKVSRNWVLLKGLRIFMNAWKRYLRKSFPLCKTFPLAVFNKLHVFNVLEMLHSACFLIRVLLSALVNSQSILYFYTYFNKLTLQSSLKKNTTISFASHHLFSKTPCWMRLNILLSLNLC